MSGFPLRQAVLTLFIFSLLALPIHWLTGTRLADESLQAEALAGESSATNGVAYYGRIRSLQEASLQLSIGGNMVFSSSVEPGYDEYFEYHAAESTRFEVHVEQIAPMQKRANVIEFGITPDDGSEIVRTLWVDEGSEEAKAILIFKW